MNEWKEFFVDEVYTVFLWAFLVAVVVLSTSVAINLGQAVPVVSVLYQWMEIVIWFAIGLSVLWIAFFVWASKKLETVL